MTIKNATNKSANIILVNWKRASDTCACLATLANLTGVEWHATICDNASPDNSFNEIRSFLAGTYREVIKSKESGDLVFDYFLRGSIESHAPLVSLLKSPCNLGFAGGNNLALNAFGASSNADYYWLLNNDTEVNPDTLSHMILRMEEDPTIGICGSTLVYAHDRKTIQAWGGAAFSRWTGAVRELGQGNTLGTPISREQVEAEMDYVSGASMLVSRKFLEEVGPLSEDYFLYYEEIDWAERARRAGYRLGYAPGSVVYHKEGAALGSGKSTGRSLLAEYYGIRNRLVFTRKFFPWALPTVYLFSALQVLRRCLQGRWQHARLMGSVLLGLRRSAP